LKAIEEAIFAGVPINVTLLFSDEHYSAAAEAYLRGVERRIDAGLNPNIASVASVFVSRWDGAVQTKVPESMQNHLGIAVAKQTYGAYRQFVTSARSLRTYNAGARPQRLLWASTGTKDPSASDTLYVESLAAPFTVNTMPEATLKAFADHGNLSGQLLAVESDFKQELQTFTKAGVHIDALAAQLQEDGAAAFAKSWDELMDVIDSKSLAIAEVS
jgi:transaldolase